MVLQEQNNDLEKSLEWQAKEKAFLDTIDIKSLVRELDTDDIYEIMDIIEERYKDKYSEEEFVFNYMDASEFEEYLKTRYPEVNIYEHTETTYHVIF